MLDPLDLSHADTLSERLTERTLCIAPAVASAVRALIRDGVTREFAVAIVCREGECATARSGEKLQKTCDYRKAVATRC